ncbi:MAG: hypothetical protein IH820_13110, partial [Bacteroidetes bacterium]|nr:hypothetical protein [Bacteroidota bacterium]
GSAPAIVAGAAAPHTRPASRRPASPALPRAESLIDTAFLWREFASAAGCRFDVEQKALDAIVFTLAAGGTSLAMPSKLEGTARRSHTLENIRYAQLEHPWQPLTLSFGVNDASHPVVYALWNTRLVGHCRPKHLAWLMPLLQTSRLGAHVIQITGGSNHRWSLGCNVVFTGICQALDAYRRESTPIVSTAAPALHPAGSLRYLQRAAATRRPHRDRVGHGAGGG